MPDTAGAGRSPWDQSRYTVPHEAEGHEGRTHHEEGVGRAPQSRRPEQRPARGRILIEVHARIAQTAPEQGKERKAPRPRIIHGRDASFQRFPDIGKLWAHPKGNRISRFSISKAWNAKYPWLARFSYTVTGRENFMRRNCSEALDLAKQIFWWKNLNAPYASSTLPFPPPPQQSL